MSIRLKGWDRIEFGYKDYAEAAYGTSPGAVPTVLFRVGDITEIAPLYDPETIPIWALRDDINPGALHMMSKKKNVRVRVSWEQGTIAQYLQKIFLTDHDNLFAEAKMYRAAGDALYLFWTGLKADKLSVRCSVGERMIWTADMIGKLYDSKLTTIHTYGAQVGATWEWQDTYLRISENDADWSLIPQVTDYEWTINNQLLPNFIFNATGSKELTNLEEREQIGSVRFTMNLRDETTWLDYLIDQTEVYIRLEMPDAKYLKLHRAKVTYMDPILKPEDLIACRVELTGRRVSSAFT